MVKLSPITNAWGQAPLLTVPAEHSIVYRAAEDAAFSHHPQITAWHGVIYATWSLGQRHEDDPGQQMVLASSTDNGSTWSSPRAISPRARDDDGTEITTTAAGLRAYAETLIATYGCYTWTPLGLDGEGHRIPHAVAPYLGDSSRRVHRHVWTEARVSADGGATWGAPVRILDRFVPNLRPLPTASGRLICAGNVTFPYTDDPSGLSGWQPAGLPRLPEDTIDAPCEWEQACCGRGDLDAAGQGVAYCEGAFYQSDDGVLHMMLRTNQPRLAVSESSDDGESWSEPALSSYTDCGSKTAFGRLPDGRWFGITCPEPGSARTPLILAASENGVVFDRHYVLGDAPATSPRFPGIHKGGRYGYPSYHLTEQTLWVIYSINKEDVALCRVALSALT